MCKDITIESPEFQEMYEEISALAETKRKREMLSEDSFRTWLCSAIQLLAAQLGYCIQNLYEFTMDMSYSFKKGFEAGRDKARKKSIRNR